MDLKRFVTILKSDSPGLIFWQNLCAHWYENCLDTKNAASVFSQARSTIDSYSWSDDEEGSSWAYQSIISETSGRQSASAVGSLTSVLELEWSRIRHISTLIDQNSFWQHYVRFSSIGHSEILDEVGARHGKLGTISEADLKDALLQALQAMSENRIDVSDRLWGAMTDGGFLRTRADRFWASFDDPTRMLAVDELVPQLGLTNFVPGMWVIEIQFDGAQVKVLLEKHKAELRRPSALCVNDTDKPRFRALRPDEIENRRLKSISPIVPDLKWHGTTLDLKQWLPGNVPTDMNGLPELFCPKLPWKQNDVKPVLNILGQIPASGATERCVLRPNNAEYAQYLGKLFSQACINDNDFVNQLEADGG
jgi:hypothetical protein